MEEIMAEMNVREREKWTNFLLFSFVLFSFFDWRKKNRRRIRNLSTTTVWWRLSSSSSSPGDADLQSAAILVNPIPFNLSSCQRIDHIFRHRRFPRSSTAAAILVGSWPIGPWELCFCVTPSFLYTLLTPMLRPEKWPWNDGKMMTDPARLRQFWQESPWFSVLHNCKFCVFTSTKMITKDDSQTPVSLSFSFFLSFSYHQLISDDFGCCEKLASLRWCCTLSLQWCLGFQHPFYLPDHFFCWFHGWFIPWSCYSTWHPQVCCWFEWKSRSKGTSLSLSHPSLISLIPLPSTSNHQIWPLFACSRLLSNGRFLLVLMSATFLILGKTILRFKRDSKEEMTKPLFAVKRSAALWLDWK